MMVEREKVLADIERSIVELAKLRSVKAKVAKALKLGTPPLDIVESVSRGLEEVGNRYERREYFLMELIVAGNMASEVMGILKPHIPSGSSASKGKVVIGTVQGDLHDIGKNIVSAMLTSVGFTVTDLGIDVPVEKFVDAVRADPPHILAMSSLLTIGLPQMKAVIDSLKKAGLRSSLKIMVGGRPITQEFADEIGADAYGRDAIEAVRIANAWAR